MKKRREVTLRKRELEERRRNEDAAKKVEAKRIEEKRKSILRENDPKVDPILKALLLAKLDLDRILDLKTEKGRCFTMSSDKIKLLDKWRLNHREIMDFYEDTYESIDQALRFYEDDSVSYKDDQEYWEEEFWNKVQSCIVEFDDAAIAYADDKLGIKRIHAMVDGPNEGGLALERGNGRFEYPRVRVARVLRTIPTTSLGYVYILTNPSLPGMVKIGQSEKSPQTQAKELSQQSGVPTPFTVAFEINIGNCEMVEERIHKRLEHTRVNNNQEFFSISVDAAAEVIRQVTKEIN
ncbi:GIY-YIG nuclease family protein [Mariniblastus sp.]|nr:GIY-YIG nuclease family protein [Mariniblastus sp.]